MQAPQKLKLSSVPTSFSPQNNPQGASMPAGGVQMGAEQALPPPGSKVARGAEVAKEVNPIQAPQGKLVVAARGLESSN